MLNRLLPDPTVTFNGHSFASLPLLIQSQLSQKQGKIGRDTTLFPLPH